MQTTNLHATPPPGWRYIYVMRSGRKTVWVGQTSQPRTRLKQHRSGKVLPRDVRLVPMEGCREEVARRRERAWIAAMLLRGCPLRNKADIARGAYMPGGKKYREAVYREALASNLDPVTYAKQRLVRYLYDIEERNGGAERMLALARYLASFGDDNE